MSEPAFSVVFGFRLEGRDGFVVSRVSLDTDRGQIVQDAQGRFPVFPSAADARAWSASRFPLPPPSPDDEIPMADLVRGTEELYATGGPALYDLDAVRRWSDDPASRAADPQQVLETWVFLHWAGLAPPVDLSDMAGYGNAREMAALAQFLRMMTRDRERRGGNAAAGAWPDEPGIWDGGENEFLASFLRPAIDAFAARIAPGTPG